jgi:hypothetical protein
MKVKDIQIMVRKLGLKPARLKKATLIHLIQNEEGNNECYETSAVTTCGQDKCLWRSDCLKSAK